MRRALFSARMWLLIHTCSRNTVRTGEPHLTTHLTEPRVFQVVFQVSRTAQVCVTPRTVLSPVVLRSVGDREQGGKAPKCQLRTELRKVALPKVQLRSVEARNVQASKAGVIPPEGTISKRIENLPRSVALCREGSVKSTLQGVFAKLKRAAGANLFQRMQERLAKSAQRPSVAGSVSSVALHQALSTLASVPLASVPVVSVALNPASPVVRSGECSQVRSSVLRLH